MSASVHSSDSVISLDAFRGIFGRKDRLRWAEVYVSGLLSDLPRKTVDSIARWWTPVSQSNHADDIRQSLNNFVQESPWDHEALMRCLRGKRLSLKKTGEFALYEISLRKQGSHSVGVYRQKCPECQTKINCQVLAALFNFNGASWVPFTMGLYLPRPWTSSPALLDSVRVPDCCRGFQSRGEILINMLRQLRAEQVDVQRVHLGDTCADPRTIVDWLTNEDIQAEVKGKRMAEIQTCVADLKDRFGLGHYEGRTWRGLHHHLSLVMLAHFARDTDVCATKDRVHF